MNWGLPLRSWADLRFQWRAALAFQLLVQLASFALIGPLLSWLARRLVLFSGDPVISNFAIASFFLSAAGVAFVLLVVVISGAALFTEFAGQTWIAGQAMARRRVSVSATVTAVARRLPALTLLSTRVLLRLFLLALPFLAAALLTWDVQLRGHDINYYLAAHPPEWRRALAFALVLGVAYLLVGLWQLARWMLAIPILIFEGATAQRALAESARRTGGHLIYLLVLLLSWWALLAVAGRVIAKVAHHLESPALRWGGIDYSRILPLVTLFVVAALVGTFLLGALVIAGHQFLVTRIHAEQLDPHHWRVPPEPEADPEVMRRIAWRLLLATGALLAIGLAVLGWIASRPTPEVDVAITAHRGDSIRAPENSLAAFRAAIEAHADYSELDVQRTRDGVVAVLHDGDLMRMAGDARRIGDLTMAELNQIDIGRKYGAAFAGEHVPTLEAVIDLVRGRMKINVELKYNAPDPQLAAATVEILRRKDFLDQVVVTSLSAAALKQVREIEPRLKTGLIVTAALGDVARAEADFLSLNSARATPEVIRRAHAAGKAVHVWTVNRAEVMLRMIERGVDNLITDDPSLAARVVQQRRSLTPAERLALRLRVLFSEPPPELTNPEAVRTL